MRNEISQKEFSGLKGPLGTEEDNRQGDSDGMIWAAACGGQASLLREWGKQQSLLGALGLLPQSQKKVKMLRFPTDPCNQASSQLFRNFFRRHLSLGQLDIPFLSPSDSFHPLFLPHPLFSLYLFFPSLSDATPPMVVIRAVHERSESLLWEPDKTVFPLSFEVRFGYVSCSGQ